MRDLHLVANAHIDPIWQWTWEEGAAEAVSTFRVAADMCEEYEGFVFNHNEAILYQWVEEYEPALFARIKGLVAAKKWHIIGGWFLQPDCNQPSGESFVRQILTGNNYFMDKFGVKPTTGVNFDVFGHSRGLVQIMKKSGYDTYVFCRPEANVLDIPDDFQWIGYDGSRILAHRSRTFYMTEEDEGAKKTKHVAENLPEVGMVLWGVGNHGGGASRTDLEQIGELQPVLREQGVNAIHSTMSNYFAERLPKISSYPEVKKTLWPCSIGCYTTQIRIKQKHRQLESAFILTEKMVSHASMLGMMDYPKAKLDEALYDLLLSEFHDSLPGSSIQRAEEEIIRMIDHGLELLSKLRIKALMKLASGAQPSDKGDVTLLFYNPHPYPVKGIWHAEVHPHRPHWGKGFKAPVAYMDGKLLPCQYEKADTNMTHDWRKGVAFEAELPASRVSVVVCKFEILPEKPKPELTETDGALRFHTDELDVEIGMATGCIERYAANGTVYIRKPAFEPLVMRDSHDSWGEVITAFRNEAGRFALADPAVCAERSGTLTGSLPAVHVIEDGEVRTIVEAVFVYGQSTICQQYILPKRGTEVEIRTRVYWNEKYKMLKLAIPTVLTAPRYLGQTAYGIEEWPCDGRETPSQRWMGLTDANRRQALTVINDGITACDVLDGELRLTLLRSPAYTAAFSHDPGNVPDIAPDRFHPAADQGERLYRFRLNAGAYDARIDAVDLDAQRMLDMPQAVAFTPSGAGEVPLPMVLLSNPNVTLAAFKRAEKTDDYVLRLFAPAGKPLETKVSIPALGIEQKVALAGFEIATFIADAKTKTLRSTDLLEGLTAPDTQK